MSTKKNVEHLTKVLKVTALDRAIKSLQEHGHGAVDESCVTVLKDMMAEVKAPIPKPMPLELFVEDAQSAGFTVKNMPTGMIIGTPDNQPLMELLLRFSLLRVARAQPPIMQNEQQEAVGKVLEVYEEGGETYGYARIKYEKVNKGDLLYTSLPKQELPKSWIVGYARNPNLKEVLALGINPAINSTETSVFNKPVYMKPTDTEAT